MSQGVEAGFTPDLIREASPSADPIQIDVYTHPSMEVIREPFKYSLQEKIFQEWAHLLGDDFNTYMNLDVFREKAEEVVALYSMTENFDQETFDRKMAYLKISALSIATSMGRDVYEIWDRKLTEKMQEKYEPNAFTNMRMRGFSIDETREYLKDLYNRGIEYQMVEVEIPESEQEARRHRAPSFPDELQDFADTWQRAAFGSDLENSDRIPVIIGEAYELMDEFKDLSENEINDLSEGAKADLILGEIADVLIAADGYFSAKDIEVGAHQTMAFKRMIDTYGDLPKLRRLGVPTRYAMHYLHDTRHRIEEGKKPKPSPVPGYKPFFRQIAQQQGLGYASGMLH